MTPEAQQRAFEDRMHSDPRFKAIEERLRVAMIDDDDLEQARALADMDRLRAELIGH